MDEVHIDMGSRLARDGPEIGSSMSMSLEAAADDPLNGGGGEEREERHKRDVVGLGAGGRHGCSDAEQRATADLPVYGCTCLSGTVGVAWL